MAASSSLSFYGVAFQDCCLLPRVWAFAIVGLFPHIVIIITLQISYPVSQTWDISILIAMQNDFS